MIILDTNVVSEILRIAPDPGVKAWLAAQRESAIYLTAINEAELRQGVGLMPPGRRRDKLAEAVENILAQKFPGRILHFDSDAAQAFASVVVARRKQGRPASPLDYLIAAIARSHGAAIATRDTQDFQNCGVEIINPWEVRV